MSKLRDRLKELARSGAQPIGFTSTATRTPPPSMLLFAQLDVAEAEGVVQAIQAGADAVLVPVGPATDERALRTIRAAAKSTLWGGVLEVGGKDAVERLQKQGCDLVVFRSGALSADSLLPEDVDKLLEVDPAWEDVLLRGVELLSVQGVLFRVVSMEAMTIHQLLQLQRVAGLTRKPAFVILPPAAGTEQLLLLRDFGVSGVVVGPGAVKAFKSAILELPRPKKSKDRLEALLPLGLHVPQHEDEEEEEEDR